MDAGAWNAETARTQTRSGPATGPGRANTYPILARSVREPVRNVRTPSLRRLWTSALRTRVVSLQQHGSICKEMTLI